MIHPTKSWNFFVNDSKQLIDNVLVQLAPTGPHCSVPLKEECRVVLSINFKKLKIPVSFVGILPFVCRFVGRMIKREISDGKGQMKAGKDSDTVK
jgi:hypothetical protein